MFEVIEGPKVVSVTPALAKRFSEMERCPADRELRPARMDRIKNIIEKGELRTCEWASAFCEETGQEYRVNGKHTSTVLATMNGSAPKGTKVVVAKYRCRTLADVSRLYSTFDSRLSIRTTTDINRVFAHAEESLRDLNDGLIGLAVTGMSFATWGARYSSEHPAEERAELLLKHPGFVLWLNQLYSGGEDNCRFLKRGPVASAMFKTWGKAQAASTTFWSSVRDGSSPNTHSPDRKLQRWLLSYTVNTGMGSRVQGKGRADAREMMVKCLHAWNAWRRNEDTDLKYYANAKLPVVA